MGYSPPSELVQITTSEEAPEGPPQDIQIESLSSTKLRVKWSSPQRHLWHGNILGYYLGYRELSLAFPSELGRDFTTPHYGLNSISSLDANGFHFKSVDVRLTCAIIQEKILRYNTLPIDSLPTGCYRLWRNLYSSEFEQVYEICCPSSGIQFSRARTSICPCYWSHAS